MERIYAAIDLKSFFASVECRKRNLDPLTTNLVVADNTRTEKTICLAISPSLKAYGLPGRARLFEVVQTELEIISGVSIETEEDIQKAAQIMIEKGGLFKIFLQENLMTI